MQIVIILGCLRSHDRKKVLHMFNIKQGKISVLQKYQFQKRQGFFFLSILICGLLNAQKWNSDLKEQW